MEEIVNYADYFTNGVWHVHTNFVDGKHSIDELCKFALEENYPLICFAEHVQKDLTFDFNKYLFEIKQAEIKYPEIVVLSGIEVKMLEEGKLNCDEKLLSKPDIVFLAEHSWEQGFDSYIYSLKQCLQHPFVQVWTHPLKIAYDKIWGVSNDIIFSLADICWNDDVVIEDNFKFKFLDTYNIFNKITQYILSGYDLHNLSEVKI